METGISYVTGVLLSHTARAFITGSKCGRFKENVGYTKLF
jgi:hypothetical protein